MQPKFEWYVEDFTAKCGLCDGIQVNGIHAYSPKHHVFKLSQNTTASVAMKMKYLHVGISNYAAIPLS